MAIIDFPILYFPDPERGRPLFFGQVLVGEPGQDPVTNPKQLNVVQTDDAVVPVPQPFILSAGGVPVYNGSPVRLDVDGNYSIKVLDRNGAQVYYIQNVFSGVPIIVDDLPQYIAAEFETVSSMVSGTSINLGSIDFSEYVGRNVTTIYHNTTTKAGGGTYTIKTESQAVADGDLIDGTGSPNFYGGNHYVGGGTDYVAVLNVEHEIYPPQYGASPDRLNADDTEVFNLCTQAALDYVDVKKDLTINLRGGDYNILGVVYVRKGQMIQGEGTHVFMSGTGGFKLGFKDDGITQDTGGRPIFMENIWMEGGLVPIDTRSVAGYTVSNCFFSFPSTGPIFAGTDGLIDLCVFDGGSTLVDWRASGSAMTNCNFFVGNTQLRIRDCDNSVISNCNFNFPQVSSIGWIDSGTVKDLSFSHCSFNVNDQNTSTFEGYVNTQGTPSGNIKISDCQFFNCFEAAVKVAGASSGHSIDIIDCVFDGTRTRTTYTQSTTMFGFRTTSSTQGSFSFKGCEFRNLFDTPFFINSNSPHSVSIHDCKFTNNAGDQSIDASSSSGNAVLSIGNIIGDNKDLISPSSWTSYNGIFNIDGFLKNWLTIQDDGAVEYVNVPFSGPAFLDITLIGNQNPGGSTQYRQITNKAASVTYDNNAGLVTQGTLTNIFDSTSPLGLSLAMAMDIGAVGAGIQVPGVIAPSLAVFSWSNSYGATSIDIQYKFNNTV